LAATCKPATATTHWRYLNSLGINQSQWEGEKMGHPLMGRGKWTLLSFKVDNRRKNKRPETN